MATKAYLAIIKNVHPDLNPTMPNAKILTQKLNAIKEASTETIIRFALDNSINIPDEFADIVKSVKNGTSSSSTEGRTFNRFWEDFMNNRNSGFNAEQRTTAGNNPASFKVWQRVFVNRMAVKAVIVDIEMINRGKYVGWKKVKIITAGKQEPFIIKTDNMDKAFTFVKDLEYTEKNNVRKYAESIGFIKSKEPYWTMYQKHIPKNYKQGDFVRGSYDNNVWIKLDAYYHGWYQVAKTTQKFVYINQYGKMKRIDPAIVIEARVQPEKPVD